MEGGQKPVSRAVESPKVRCPIGVRQTPFEGEEAGQEGPKGAVVNEGTDGQGESGNNDYTQANKICDAFLQLPWLKSAIAWCVLRLWVMQFSIFEKSAMVTHLLLFIALT